MKLISKYMMLYAFSGIIMFCYVLSTSAASMQGNINSTSKKQQIISFLTPIPDSIDAGNTFFIKALGGKSGNPITIESQTPNICTVVASGHSKASVEAISKGQCLLILNQLGNSKYSAAQQLQSNVTVNKIKQTLNINAPQTLVIGGNATVFASSDSGLPVVFQSENPTTCTIEQDSGIVSGKKNGDCLITIRQSGNNLYTSTQSEINVEVIDIQVIESITSILLN